MRRLPLSNPKNPWVSQTVEYDPGETPLLGLEIFEQRSRQIVSKNKSPDLPFRYSLNPYRGCAHGCAYCYARPSHEYLGFGAGSDFERKLVVKPDAPTLLKQTFASKRWHGELLVLSGNTDPYQPIEARYRLTRQCLEVCRDHANPVHIITKGTLVERDLTLLKELHQRASVSVAISVTFWDEQVSRALEPYAPSAQRRIETIARLSAEGIAVMVNVAPVVYGLSDQDMIPILEAARKAGARAAMMTPVRLPGNVAVVFEERLRAALPLRADRVLARIRESRGGELNDSRFGSRFEGQGKYAEALSQIFRATCKRLGYTELPPPVSVHFTRTHGPTRQLSLF